VAEEFGLEPAQLYGKDRRGSVSAARHLACAAVRMGTKLSLNEIGAAFGNRDHATVMSAIRRGRCLAETDERLGDILEEPAR
jgi:chromosomal replication initiator protein